jgi:hypothetical protein
MVSGKKSAWGNSRQSKKPGRLRWELHCSRTIVVAVMGLMVKE